MSCDFSLAHYRELLAAAGAGGYRFAFFDREPRDGDRRGYVIATADTNLEALDRAEAAARLLDVEVE